MKLAALQAAILKRLQKYRTHPPSFGERARLSTPYLGVLLVLFVALGYVVSRLQIPGSLLLIAGIFLGVVAAELGNQNRYVRFWPLNREITDWQKVDQLVSGTAEVSLPLQPERAPKSRVGFAVVIGLVGFAVVFGLAIGAQRALAFAYDPTRNNPRHGVIVLTASWCGYCLSLRHHLTEMGIHYTDMDVEKTTEGAWAMTAVRARGVPVTIVGDKVIRGVGKPGSQWVEVDSALRKAGYVLPPQ
jgi:glutaredoxin